MNKRLIFRILGALASALIIVAVFVPFVSVTGYVVSLWESLSDSLYLPIMIIAFGLIGVIFFSLNIKTEFAYMSTGAITFFIVVQTVDVISQGAFSSLSVGYYFLIIGAIVTGIMAFLMNLKLGKSKDNVGYSSNEENQTSLIGKIDGLYNEQNVSSKAMEPIQTIQNGIQPLPIQPIPELVPVPPVEPVQPIPEPVPVPPVEPVQPIPEPVPVPPVEPVEPIPEPVPVQSIELVQPIPEPVPVLEQFNQPVVNPVLQEFSTISPNQSANVIEQPVIPNIPDVQVTNTNQDGINNPIVQEFINPETPSSVVPQAESNAGGVDIFGQPINK